MSLVHPTILEMRKLLTNLEGWLDKAVAHAKAKSFDPNVLLGARLAPDQFAFVRQVQSACDNAKFTAARLSGKEAPKHPDTEQTIDDLKSRIHAVLSYLDSFKASDFDGAETRAVSLAYLEGKVMSGADYLTEQVLPNFYFHLVHSYAILRHNGVDLGKRDYIGKITTRER